MSMEQIFKKCPNCDGLGYVYQTIATQLTSGASICIWCSSCDGRGVIPTELYAEDMPEFANTTTTALQQKTEEKCNSVLEKII